MGSVLTDYETRLAQSDNSFLGRLFWYTLSELRVPHGELIDHMEAVGITERHPRVPFDTDVFKRICSKVKRVKLPTPDPDVFDSWRMVEFKDDDTVTRRVVRERVNSAGRKLDVAQVFDIVFSRATGDLVFKPFPGHRFRPGSVAESIRDEILEEYYLWRGCLNGYAIREWVRAAILELGATMVRPGGGVYFVPERMVPKIAALEELGARLDDYTVEESGSVEFHSLPLIDDTKQREMIQRAFEAETVDAVDELMTRVTELAGGEKKITSDRYAALVSEYQDLFDKTSDYESLLEHKLASTGKRLELFQKSLVKLRKKVKD